MTQPLRIAIFVGTFPVISEIFIVRQIIGLLDMGHDVDIYSDCRADPNQPVHSEVASRRLLERTVFMDLPPEMAPYEIPIWPITAQTWPPGAELAIPNSTRLLRAIPVFFRCFAQHPRLTFDALDATEYGYQAASLSALYRLARLSAVRKRYDLLHAHFGPVANSFRFARKLWKVPLVVSFHGFDFTTVPRKQGANVYEKLFQVADAVTANSEFTRNRLEKLGAPGSRLVKLPVGLNPAEIPFRERMFAPDRPVRILTVARLVEIKGHEYSIRAVAELRKLYPMISYGIVGDGPLRPKLEKLIAELGLENIVLLHGARAGSDLKAIIDAADLFMLNSVEIDGDAEGQGLVLQEAQAAGLPVVATNHGAFPEGIVPGESGFLVPEKDVAALAERLSWLIEHSESWATMGRHGRRFAQENYDILKLNLQLDQIYRTAINNYHRN